MEDDIVLSVRNVSKCFEMYEKPVHRLYQTLFAGHKKFYKEFWALRDISFEVRRGECVGIIGRNGAGKSTLLQIITGTLAPTTGEVKMKGRVAALLELGSGFNPEFTGRENVYLNGSILGLTKAEIDARYDEILAFADIGEFIDQPVKTYSSGMMVRLAFSVQVMVDPDILIVDEALAVGDAAFQRKCFARLQDLIRSGTTLFLVTHDISTVRSICSRVVYLKGGQIVMIGEAKRVSGLYMRDIFPDQAEGKSDSTERAEISREEGAEASAIQPNDEHRLVWRRQEGGSVISFGAGVGWIDEVVISGLKSGNVMPRRGKVRIQIRVSWDIEATRAYIAKEHLVSNLYYGFSVMTQNNVQLFGGNTYTQGLRIDPASRSSHMATFEVDWPELQIGSYFLSVAISAGTPRASAHLKWSDFALELVSDEEIRGGIFLPPVKLV